MKPREALQAVLEEGVTIARDGNVPAADRVAAIGAVIAVAAQLRYGQPDDGGV